MPYKLLKNNYRKRKKIFEELVKLGANPKLECKNEKKKPIAVIIVEKIYTEKPTVFNLENIEFLKLLALHKYNINAMDPDKKTALYCVVENKAIPDEVKLETARLLIENGASVNIKPKKGNKLKDLPEKNSELFNLLSKSKK